ncbi:hypothetical protein EIJ81_00185 (plasmid) [Aliivibrio salmonicida]|uniref:hypothetical protein n=1 Tax=Aliivibrio salmonicida TaxID=40269 RepID=UPI000F6BFEDE|nr:hypothetical protein [Aliivibrio salmonicida]AZL83322.1 hypothetical protein EIJ81_00185 [Aliivibrio salmonicida]
MTVNHESLNQEKLYSFYMYQLNDPLVSLLIQVPEITGSFSPDNLQIIEPQLRENEIEIVKDFFKFVFEENLTFGQGNIKDVFKTYILSKSM